MDGIKQEETGELAQEQNNFQGVKCKQLWELTEKAANVIKGITTDTINGTNRVLIYTEV